MILYIPGFGGSPEGSTVQLLRKHMEPLRVEGLQYDARDPKGAIEQLIEQYYRYEKLLDVDDYDNDKILLMGSSLGGFYASQVAAIVGCKLILFNPALNPVESLMKYDGEVINTPDGQRVFTKQHVERYSAMSNSFDTLRMNNFGLQLYTTNDPVIDNKLASRLCQGFSRHIHLSDVNEHRLSESSLMIIKENVQGCYHSLAG